MSDDSQGPLANTPCGQHGVSAVVKKLLIMFEEKQRTLACAAVQL